MSNLISRMDPKSELNDMMGNYMISNDAQSSFFKTPKMCFMHITVPVNPIPLIS